MFLMSFHYIYFLYCNNLLCANNKNSQLKPEVIIHPSSQRIYSVQYEIIPRLKMGYTSLKDKIDGIYT